MKWNILVVRGIKINKNSVSTGEGKWKNEIAKISGPMKL